MNLAPESLPLWVGPKPERSGWDSEGFLIRTATGAWIIDVDPEGDRYSDCGDRQGNR